MKFSWRLRFRTSPPHPCSWRRSLWSPPWCTTSPSSTRSRMEMTGECDPNLGKGKVSPESLSSVTFPFQRVHVWEDVLPAAHGHAAVPVLPEAKTGVRGEGRRHQGCDGDRQAWHRMEDQSRREREATDQSAAKNGMRMFFMCKISFILSSRVLFLFYPCLSSRLQGTETSDCLWRWFLTPSTLKNLLTLSVKSPTAGKKTKIQILNLLNRVRRPQSYEQPSCVAAKEPWTWCWRCVTPGRSTGAAYPGDSWGNLAPVPSSLCPSRSSRPSRVCR